MPARKYSRGQKDRFFEVLDRGGTVRAAAAAVGVHPQAAYSWLRQAGMAMRRASPRVYSDEDRAAFFRLLAERKNVSAVVRELGFVPVTCYKWAHQAGVFTGKDVDAVREEFLRLRKAGKSRLDAAAAVGVDKRSAQDWDKGIRKFSGGRVYPDGRVVRYRPEEILAGAKSPRASYVHGERLGLDRLERIVHPRYLSLVEREQLHDLRKAGMTVTGIAEQMRRSPSTISRELRRNTAS